MSPLQIKWDYRTRSSNGSIFQMDKYEVEEENKGRKRIRDVNYQTDDNTG